jgi:hypothetical protein
MDHNMEQNGATTTSTGLYATPIPQKERKLLFGLLMMSMTYNHTSFPIRTFLERPNNRLQAFTYA